MTTDANTPIHRTMLPSHVVVQAVVPLGGVFGHVEAECAAALIVAILALGADTWGPCSYADGFRLYADELGRLEWLANPFLRPDIDDLVERGFATLSSDRKIVEFTEAGLVALESSGWNRDPAKAVA